MILDEQDRKYIDEKFNKVYAKTDKLGERVASIETRLNDNGFVKESVCEVVQKIHDERHDEVSGTLSQISSRLWWACSLVLGGVLLAILKVVVDHF